MLPTLSKKQAGALFALSQALVLVFGLACVLHYNLGQLAVSAVFALAIICIPVDIALFWVLEAASKRQAAVAHMRALEAQQQATKAYGQRIQAELAEAAAATKAIKQQVLQAKEGLEQQGAVGGTPVFAAQKSQRFCDHNLVDALVSLKAEEAKKIGAACEFKLDVPRDLALSSTELCAVFSNVLDNALHACEALPQAQRHIVLCAGERAGFFVVECVNSCDPEAEGQQEGRCMPGGAGKQESHRESDAVDQQKSRRASHEADQRKNQSAPAKTSQRRGLNFASQKGTALAPGKSFADQHGWGRGILEAIAQRHQGFCETKQQDGQYTVMVALSIA